MISYYDSLRGVIFSDLISSNSSYIQFVGYCILYWYPPSFTLRFSSILGPMVILVSILFYKKKKLSPSTGNYHLPNSNPQGPLCGWSLCCLQAASMFSFSRYQLRSARFTLLDFCVPVCACMYSFFFVFWECFTYYLCTVTCIILSPLCS